MSPRSERSSASLPSNPPALISTPDQVADAVDGDGDRAAGDGAVDGGLVEPGLGVLELLLHLLGLLQRAFMSKPPAATAERVEGFWVMVASLGRRGWSWSVTGAGSPRSSGRPARARAARRCRAPLVSASGSSGWASASARARGRPRRARLRAGLGDGSAGGSDGARGRPIGRPAALAPWRARGRRSCPGRRTARRPLPMAARRSRRRQPAARRIRVAGGAGDRRGRRRVWAPGSTMASTRQSTPTTSIAAWRRISSQPPLTKESRAPALLKPRVRVLPSTPMTWEFWVRCIQATRRRSFVASTMSGQRRRTSTSVSPPVGLAAARRGVGAAAAVARPGQAAARRTRRGRGSRRRAAVRAASGSAPRGQAGPGPAAGRRRARLGVRARRGARRAATGLGSPRRGWARRR